MCHVLSLPTLPSLLVARLGTCAWLCVITVNRCEVCHSPSQALKSRWVFHALPLHQQSCRELGLPSRCRGVQYPGRSANVHWTWLEEETDLCHAASLTVWGSFVPDTQFALPWQIQREINVVSLLVIAQSSGVCVSVWQALPNFKS